VGSAVSQPGVDVAVRRLGWKHPEWPWAILAVGAWTSVGWVALAKGAGGEHMAHMGAAAGRHHAAAGGTAAHWIAMVAAMMLPAALPAIRAVSMDSLWHRRLRAGAVFAGVYLGAWIGVAGAALGAWSLLGTRDGPAAAGAAAVLLATGSGWQITRWQRRCVKACHRRLPVGVRGRSADIACARSGAAHASACIGACWAMMLAMVPGGSMGSMVALAGLTSWQRLARRPRRVLCALALLALAAIDAIAALGGAGPV